MRRKPLFFGLLAVLTIGIALAAARPLRVLMPEAQGLTCITDTICVEVPATAIRALALFDAALFDVETRLGPLNTLPNIYFCSTTACFERFGNPQVAGLYFWGLDTITLNGPEWEPHILRHELIHHWQRQQYGLAWTLTGRQMWFIEGMAYSLSDDPRRPLPRDDIEAWRTRFEAWLAESGDLSHLPE